MDERAPHETRAGHGTTWNNSQQLTAKTPDGTCSRPTIRRSLPCATSSGRAASRPTYPCSTPWPRCRDGASVCCGRLPMGWCLPAPPSTNCATTSTPRATIPTSSSACNASGGGWCRSSCATTTWTTSCDSRASPRPSSRISARKSSIWPRENGFASWTESLKASRAWCNGCPTSGATISW